MKTMSYVLTFLGGTLVGAVSGVLFAPKEGKETRQKIADILHEKGLKLSHREVNNLADQIASEMK